MKSTTFALLASLAQVVHVSSAAAAVAVSPLNNRNPSPSPEGVLLNLPQPHDQIRLIHQHPKTISSSSLSLSTKRADSSSSVQGGAVLSVSSTSQKKITSISATFRVPEAKVPTIGPTANNPVGVYASSFWVGIDGVTLPSTNASCNAAGASLRLGVDIFYDGTFGGEQTPFAWYQYLPRSATGFSNISVAPGDIIRLSASASTSSGVGGTVTIENFGPETNTSSTPGKKIKAKAPQTATHTFTSPSQGGQEGELPALCQSQAAIIVEDFPLAGMPDFPIALANFTSVEFGDVKVSGTAGQKLDLLAASNSNTNGNGKKASTKAKGQVQVLNIVQPPQGGRLTDCRIGKQSAGGKSNSGVVVCDRVVIP